MADTSVQEDMEVEENPGEPPKINDLKVIINGKNNEYMIIIIFRLHYPVSHNCAINSGYNFASISNI